MLENKLQIGKKFYTMGNMADTEKIGYRESLEGLPQELLDTLSIAKINPLDKALLDIIKSFGGIATLDEIAIRHYRQTNTITKRSILNNRLLALVKKQYLLKKAGQKGVYILKEREKEKEMEKDDVPFN